jgi:uncharacterized protein YbjT (DUF2867 family)
MKKDKILVIGSSGTVGSELVNKLIEHGEDVLQATSRDVNESNKVFVDLVTGQGMKDAFSRVNKVFILSPPGFADQYSILGPLIQEAKNQKLDKVVLMTAMGANADESSPFRRAEVELEKSGLKYNIIRPNWFFQNFNTFWVQGIKDQGLIALPAGEAQTSFIDSRDVSEVAAKLLITDKFNNQDFDLSGAKAYSHKEIADAISKVINRKISYEDIKPEILKTGLADAGIPVDYVDFLIHIFGFLKEGYNAGITSNVETILNRTPRTLENYIETYKDSWV